MLKSESQRHHPFLSWAQWIVTAFGIFLSVLSLLGFLGGCHWMLDLCSHFRVQYAISLTLLSGLSLGLRQRKTALGCLFAAGVNAAVVIPFYFGALNPTPSGEPTLRAMLLNVNTQAGDPQLVKKAVQDANPDLLVLEEISGRWMQELAWLKASHPYAVTQPREDNFGIGLFSKHPLIDGKIINIGMNVPSVVAGIRFNRNFLRIVATHPTPPTSAEYARWRDRQLDKLPNYLGPPWPIILIGDLNATSWSYPFQRLVKRTGLIDSSKGQGVHPTWPNDNFFVRIPIDHLLHSPDIAVVKRSIGGDVASDHFPVIVDLWVRPGGAPVGGPTWSSQ